MWGRGHTGRGGMVSNGSSTLTVLGRTVACSTQLATVAVQLRQPLPVANRLTLQAALGTAGGDGRGVSDGGRGGGGGGRGRGASIRAGAGGQKAGASTTLLCTVLVQLGRALPGPDSVTNQATGGRRCLGSVRQWGSGGGGGREGGGGGEGGD